MKDKTRILVVDDEREICELLKEFLESKGYAVMISSGGADALTCVLDQQPDLVLMDVRMPGLDGLETQRRLRAIDPSIDVIILTGVCDEDIAIQAMQDGARKYLCKPLTLADLERAITLN
jgi:DNA-binding response OmpR family regulator